jgi:hypothetical protein
VRHPKNKWRKLTIFEWFSTQTAQARPLRGILTAVAEHYPNAIVLPLTISVPGLTFEPSQREDRQFAEALLAQVTFEPLGIFIRELEKLHHPVGPDVCGWPCSCFCLSLLWWLVCAVGWFVSVLSVSGFVGDFGVCSFLIFVRFASFNLSLFAFSLASFNLSLFACRQVCLLFP